MVIFWKYSGNATELPKPVPRNEIIYRPLAIGMVTVGSINQLH
ncbi:MULTISPECIES: hypothetical protein [unclassified Synechocystis]|nr:MULTISPECIES: hypothetical protein [unclassified Synechocystis]